MSLAPRTPDLKANLDINNGTFGTLLGSASIGSIIMLLIGGQIVHRIGAKRSLQIGSTAVAITYTGLVNTSSPILFLILNILAGASVSIYHIATSGHSLHRQDEVGAVIVPKLHGAWAVGAMSTSAIAFLISDSVSISSHITTLMFVVWLLTQFCIKKLAPTFPDNPTSDDDYQATSLQQFKFKINWFLSLGFFCATVLEFTIADWATLFGKEELGMSSSVATLCYLTCLIGLIVGRYSIGWALNHQSEQFWIKAGGLNIFLNRWSTIKWQKRYCSCAIKFYQHCNYVYLKSCTCLGCGVNLNNSCVSNCILCNVGIGLLWQNWL